MATYSIISNRGGDIAVSDDLENAGRIVNALMLSRDDPDYFDYWVRDDAGNEYYWDRAYATVFSAACGEGDR